MQIDLTNIYKKYKGLWVALTDSWTFISSDKDIKRAHAKAIKAGHKNPIMFKVPKENIAYFGSSF